MMSARSACTQTVPVGYDVGAGAAAVPPKRSITTGPARPAGAAWMWATWGRASPGVSVSGPTDQHTSSWPGFNRSSIDPRSASPCGFDRRARRVELVGAAQRDAEWATPIGGIHRRARTTAPRQSPTTAEPMARIRPLVTARAALFPGGSPPASPGRRLYSTCADGRRRPHRARTATAQDGVKIAGARFIEPCQREEGAFKAGIQDARRVGRLRPRIAPALRLAPGDETDAIRPVVENRVHDGPAPEQGPRARRWTARRPHASSPALHRSDQWPAESARAGRRLRSFGFRCRARPLGTSAGSGTR